MIPVPAFTTRDIANRPSPSTGQRKYLLHHFRDDEYICEIDWSSIEKFTTCDRSALWSLVHGRIGRRHPALTYGSALHRGLELWYGNSLLGALPIEEKHIMTEVSKIFLADPPPLGEWRTLDKCVNALSLYFKNYSSLDSQWEIKMVERAFSLPICTIDVNDFVKNIDQLLSKEEIAKVTFRVYDNDELATNLFISKLHFLWTGVIDLIFRESGSLWIMDHKTTSVEGDSFWKAFELSQQFMGYQWAAQEILGEPIKGVLANVIYERPPAATLATQKKHDLERFKRRRLYYKSEHIAEWRSNMTTILEDFTHHLVSGVFPMKAQWCVNKYGTCPYHDVCSLVPEHRLTMLNTDQYENNVWSPLL